MSVDITVIKYCIFFACTSFMHTHFNLLKGSLASFFIMERKEEEEEKKKNNRHGVPSVYCTNGEFGLAGAEKSINEVVSLRSAK